MIEIQQHKEEADLGLQLKELEKWDAKYRARMAQAGVPPEPNISEASARDNSYNLQVIKPPCGPIGASMDGYRASYRWDWDQFSLEIYYKEGKFVIWMQDGVEVGFNNQAGYKVFITAIDKTRHSARVLLRNPDEDEPYSL